MTDKTYTLPEVKQELAKALRERVNSFSQEMLALRKKELAKSEVCVLCGNLDKPGACTCLSKSVEKCDTDEVKPLNKEDMCPTCGMSECLCGEIERDPEEPVKAEEGSGGEITKLKKEALSPVKRTPAGGRLSKMGRTPTAPKAKSPLLSRKLGKAGMAPAKPTTPSKPAGATPASPSKPPAAPKVNAPKAPSPASAPSAKNVTP